MIKMRIKSQESRARNIWLIYMLLLCSLTASAQFQQQSTTAQRNPLNGQVRWIFGPTGATSIFNPYDAFTNDAQLKDRFGSIKVGRFETTLGDNLHNLNGSAALKQFYKKLYNNIPTERVNVNLVGTSISFGPNSGIAIAMASLADYFGSSKSYWAPFAEQAGQPVNGWKPQFYSGMFSIRLRAGSTDGATSITKEITAKKVTFFYSTETDGGSLPVSIQSGSGSFVAQTPINCNGATSFGNSVTYNLDPNATTVFKIDPPTSGFGYLEYYVVDAGDNGVMFSNTSFGGSSLANIAGTSQRTAGTGMYPTATPSGDLGLIAAFAPTNSQIKPALVCYSGPTNDNSTDFAANLKKAVEYAIANGSSCLLVIEPINHDANKTNWDIQRKAYYDVAALHPDDVFVYDFDAFLSQDLAFNPHFHSPSLSDPHPGDYGYGDPQLSYGVDLCQRLGIPFIKQYRDFSNSAYSTLLTQGTEPLNAPIGSIWLDNSNGAIIRKVLVARPNKASGRGIWRCENGTNKLLADQTFFRGRSSSGSWTEGLNYYGNPAVIVSGSSVLYIDNPEEFVGGKTYTLSFSYSMLQSGAASLSYGSTPNYFTLSSSKGKFDLSSNSFTKMVSSDRDKFSLTFKYPTQAELDAATAAGVDIAGGLTFGLQGNITVWDFKIEQGASITNGTVVPENKATDYPIAGISKATEPLKGEIAEQGVWIDASNTIPVSKVLVQSDNIVNIKPAAFNGAGNSLWRNKDGGTTNLLKTFVTNSTISLNGTGATIVKGNYGPGLLPGFRLDITSTGGKDFKIEAPTGEVFFNTNTVYTLSFLAKAGDLSGIINPNKLGVLLQICVRPNSSGTYTSLSSNDLQVWTTSGGQFQNTYIKKDAIYRRYKITFMTYAVSPDINSNIVFALRPFISGINQFVELSDFRLEQGASVTTDASGPPLNFAINTTTSALSAATLNSSYPAAPIGFRVICGSISGGGVTYTKFDTSTWLATSSPVQP